MKARLAFLALFFLAIGAKSQRDNVSIHIRLIDGQTGHPMANEQVGLEDGTDYHEIAARTDNAGVAMLQVRRNGRILTHNTEGYVNCGDERGGLVHNDFGVSQIVTTGIAQAIAQPNLCWLTNEVAKPGDLVLFVRRWRLGEKI